MASLPRRGLTPHEFDEHRAKLVLAHLLRKEVCCMAKGDDCTLDARNLKPTE